MDFVKFDSERDDEATQGMPVIFGLRFLEDEEAEIHDIVGCRIGLTGCDDDGGPVIVLA